MKNKELWLEFGHNDRNNSFRKMVWCNEGRWQEIPYFIRSLWSWRNKEDVYFLWRFGKESHFLRGRS